MKQLMPAYKIAAAYRFRDQIFTLIAVKDKFRCIPGIAGGVTLTGLGAVLNE
ncbi:MAG: hypothetical protein H6937_03185 [Burkholderiales bacterium]|nr:hypothetical protein [Burkholderiales bacterium]MDR4518582.1 hypothetical protein [Nitrosomonas sp.]